MGAGRPRAARAAGAALAALAAGAALAALGVLGGAGACARCRALGAVLEREVAGLEGAAAAERPQRGRVMSVSALPHRDAVEYFESACEGVEVRAGGTEGEGLGALCSGLVLPHTAPLADFVFAGGAEGLASYLCQHLSRSCDPDL